MEVDSNWDMDMVRNSSVPGISAAAIRTERLLKMANLLQNSPGWTTTALAERFNVCRRTIFRDLQLLRQAELPLHVDEQFGGFRLSTVPPPSTSRFEADELIALVQAIRQAKPLPRSVSQTCDRVIAKVFAAADPEAREQASRALQRAPVFRLRV